MPSENPEPHMEELVAQTILQGFDAQYDRFLEVTSGSQNRFREIPRPLSLDFPLVAGVPERLRVILCHTPLRLSWEDMARDIGYIHQHLLQRFGEKTLKTGVLQIYKELFFRNKAAWLVGKVRPVGHGVFPFLLPIHQNENGELYVDTCLTEFVDAGTVFSFAHSYFMVYAPLPAATVEWLRKILPTKTTAELYIAIACQKHGKTEYHREYLNHVAGSSEQFIIAPGIKGMVMLVFTLSSFNQVFKVIKDRFASQKEMSENDVKAKYRLMKEHDRVGRMADTQEYENFVIDKNRISPELMEELQREVSQKLEDLGDQILINHLYIERRITPLNIYLDQANEIQLRDAIEEYGNAIKQMAAANIFLGDMLFKNFGITRHGRVVFYDYDEISYMTDKDGKTSYIRMTNNEHMIFYVKFAGQEFEVKRLNSSDFDENSTAKVEVNIYWKHKNLWDSNWIEQYREEIPMLSEALEATQQRDPLFGVWENKPFTCEDFAVTLLILFAYRHGLPIILDTGAARFSSIDFLYNPQYKRSSINMEGFLQDVLTVYGARDTKNNCVALANKTDAKAGDFFLRKDNGHVQVVISASSNRFVIKQGNIPTNAGNAYNRAIGGWAGRTFGQELGHGSPMSPYYLGTQVQMGIYIRNSNNEWIYTRDGNLDQGETWSSKMTHAYKWEFYKFNSFAG